MVLKLSIFIHYLFFYFLKSSGLYEVGPGDASKNQHKAMLADSHSSVLGKTKCALTAILWTFHFETKVPQNMQETR